jgi:hypothetical protein
MGNTLRHKVVRSTKAVRAQLAFATIACVTALGVRVASASEQSSPENTGNVAQRLYVPPPCDATCQTDGTYGSPNTKVRLGVRTRELFASAGISNRQVVVAM